MEVERKGKCTMKMQTTQDDNKVLSPSYQIKSKTISFSPSLEVPMT